MIHHLLYILQEMETDKNEDEDKKKKGEVLFCGASITYMRRIRQKRRLMPLLLCFSSKVRLHQGQREDHDASGAGETGDRRLQGDHHHRKSPPSTQR